MNTSIPQKRCSVCNQLLDITCFYPSRQKGKNVRCKACEQGKPYVYALAYPETMGGCIFYVGKGVARRINQHENEARGYRTIRNRSKCMVIWDIWEHGEEVDKKKLAYFATDEEALLYEFALLFFLPNLTNHNETPPPLLENEEYNRMAREITRLPDEERRRLAREVTRRIAEQQQL